MYTGARHGARDGGSRRPAAHVSLTDDAASLADFQWSDGVVGIGYFPDEVALPEEWRWSVDGPP